MPRRQFPHLPDRLLVQLCDSFLAGDKAGAVAQMVNDQLARLQREDRVTRQQIYALLNDARQRGLFQLRAPRHEVLAQRIADLYKVDKDALIVADARGERTSEHLAEEAARLVVRLIFDVSKRRKKERDRAEPRVPKRKRAGDDAKEEKKEVVHIGLGAGFTTLNIARHLAHELRALPDHPDLVLHALSPGFQVDRPQTSPLGFFGLFDGFSERVRYVGLFAASGLSAERYKRDIRRYPVSVAFDRKDEIDIIITSLASAKDKHGNLNQFLEAQKGETGEEGEDVDKLHEAGWIGDLQYRPFSATGDIKGVQKTWAVTLFELDALRKFAAKPDKHLLLVSGPCVDCKSTREAPMEVLLSVPDLKVWTHVIMDVTTAEKLVAMAEEKDALEGHGRSGSTGGRARGTRQPPSR